MKALLLAAGYATRLYPLTLDKPKALLPVAGKPIIGHILSNIEQVKDINEVLVITNNKFFKHFDEYAKTRNCRQKIKVLNDGTVSNDDRLGAIGDIAFAIKKEGIKEGLLVVGADNIFDARLTDFLKFVVSKKMPNCIALFDLKNKGLATKYGVVSVDKDSKVTDFEEKPKEPKSTYISTCIYYFPKERLGLFDKYLKGPGNPKDASGNYIKWLSEVDSVYGYPINGRWYDIGDMESYKKADEDFKVVPRD